MTIHKNQRQLFKKKLYFKIFTYGQFYVGISKGKTIIIYIFFPLRVFFKISITLNNVIIECQRRLVYLKAGNEIVYVLTTPFE